MLLPSILQDVRIGFRVLIKERFFCALAVIVLALGICAVTTQFAVVNATVLRGLPFPDSDRLMDVALTEATAANGLGGVPARNTAADFEDLKAAQKSFAGFSSYLGFATVNITVDGAAQRLEGAYISDDLFRTLGVTPILGRDFTPEDNRPGAPSVVLLSHQLWKRDFSGRADVVGQAIRLNGRSATVVGVMPPHFNFPFSEQIWVPFYNQYPVYPRNSPQISNVQIVGRLKPGVSVDQATLEFIGLARNFAEAFPDTNKDFVSARVQPLVTNYAGPFLRNLLFTMLAFCGGVLLIACVNVMNMQFARANLRARELAIRSSLGATRSRLMRQMLTESLLIACLGAALGIIAAYWAVDLLDAVSATLPFARPYWVVFVIDGPVLGFTVGATMLSAIISGLVPAWLASRANAADVMKESGRSNSSRLANVITRGLVVFQILVTCILLVGSLLQVKAITRQQGLDFGYETSAVYSVRVGLFEADYPTPQARALFFDRALQQLRSNPEFAGAALTSRLRMLFNPPAVLEIEGATYQRPTDRPRAYLESVSEGYFTALGQQLVVGRDFTSDDSDAKLPVAIVSANFARKYFGQDNPIGRRFRTVGANESFGVWRTIIGVSPALRMGPPFAGPVAIDDGFYVPLSAAQYGPVPPVPAVPRFATLLVRVQPGQSGEAAAAILQRAMRKIDPNLPLYNGGTTEHLIGEALGNVRLNTIMFSIFGAVAMVLASVGLYGVTSFSVSQRRQEFGIRMALGADRLRILRHVFGQSLAQLGLGLLVGIGSSLGIAAFWAQDLGRFLFQTSLFDAPTYLTVAALLSVVSLAATFIPARRATRIDPMVALRSD